MPHGDRQQALPAGAPKVTFEAWWMLSVLFLLYVFSIVDRHVITMMVPEIKKDLRLTDFEMGLILGPAFSLFYAAFGIPLGWAGDKFPRRWVIFLGVCLFSVATVCASLSFSFFTLFAARLFVGVGEAALSPAAYSLMSDRFPKTMLATASSIYNTAAKIGVTGAYVMGSLALLLASSMHIELPGLGVIQPWRLVMTLTGAPAALLGLLVFTFREPARSGGSRRANLGSPDLLNYLWSERRLFVPMLLGFSLMGLCSYALTAWVPTYLTRSFKMEAVQYGPILGGVSLAAGLTLVVKGMVVDALFARGVKDAHIRFYTWILLASIPLAFVMFFMRNPYVFMIMYGAVQVVAIPVVVYMSAAIQVIAPNNLRGQLIAVQLLSIAVIGGGLGPVVVAFFTDFVFRDNAMVGYSIGIVLSLAMPAAWILLRLALRPLRKAVLTSEEKSAAFEDASPASIGGNPAAAAG